MNSKILKIIVSLIDTLSWSEAKKQDLKTEIERLIRCEGVEG